MEDFSTSSFPSSSMGDFSPAPSREDLPASPFPSPLTSSPVTGSFPSSPMEYFSTFDSTEDCSPSYFPFSPKDFSLFDSIEDCSPSSFPFSSIEHFSPSSCSNKDRNENEIVPSSSRPYDVFLNHRGPDVKNLLASSIYHWLADKGLRVFLDKEEFQAGDGLHPTIEQAIRSAAVHIAIFSKTYAESSWCLDELCSMLKSGAKIIPIFYDVQPSDLRWIAKGKGLYAAAFANHQKKRRVHPRKLDEWKDALRRISFRHGLELNGPKFNGDLGKLLRSIVNSVSEAVAAKKPLESAKDPVGLDKIVQDFQEFIECEAQRTKNVAVKIVGIVGFGGSGKTTLAMQFYNIRRSSFSESSFLFDVRHASELKKLQSLQRKLLKDLLQIDDGNIENFSVREGRRTLTEKVRSSMLRALVVLDDIDHDNQVEDLLEMDVLGSGSLILMTSRDEGVLRKSGADSIYKIKPLHPNDALELFCRHAFLQPRPKMGFEDLAQRFCRRCGGLPLFLKLMGAHLRVTGKDDEDAWREELEGIPDGMKNILNNSYGLLPEEEKQTFLDAACFFLEEDASTAIRIWNGSHGRGSARLKSLVDKCLLQIDDQNRLRMHNHLQDFAREVAEKTSPWRCWHPHQISNIEERLKGGREVRGIMAPTSDLSHILRLSSAFEEIDLSRLKLLVIKGDCFESRFGQLATSLLWFRWNDCPHTNIPSWLISMKNLTVLQIIGGTLEEWPVCDKPLPLKELKIQRTGIFRISIPKDVCPHLEHLDLSDNRHLIEVENLPTTLVELNLGFCPTLKTISGSLHLKKLKTLNVCFCHALEELPNLKHLSSLQTLKAECCRKLQNMQGLEHLRQLQTLKISSCSELRELPNLCDMSSLVTLEAEGCRRLQNIKGLERLLKLQTLNMSACSGLNELPDLSELRSLETLQAGGCWQLQGIRGLDQLQALTFLQLSAAYDSRAMLESIQRLKKLPSTVWLSGVGIVFEKCGYGSEINYLGEKDYQECWRSEMVAPADGMPCSTVMVCFDVQTLDAWAKCCPQTIRVNFHVGDSMLDSMSWHSEKAVVVGGEGCTCVGIFSELPYTTSQYRMVLEVFRNADFFQVGMGWMCMVSKGDEGEMLPLIYD